MVIKKTVDEEEKITWKCLNCGREIEVKKYLLERGIVYCPCVNLTKQKLVIIKRKKEKEVKK